MVKALAVSEEELLKELKEWEESVKRALESDKELKNIVYDKVKSVVEPIARFVEKPSFDEFVEKLSRVADKVKSYVRWRYGVEPECNAIINAGMMWVGYFKREIEKNRPLSSVRLLVKCIIPAPKKFVEAGIPEASAALELEVNAPLFFEYTKYEGKWRIAWSALPYDPDDVRVEVTAPT